MKRRYVSRIKSVLNGPRPERKRIVPADWRTRLRPAKEKRESAFLDFSRDRYRIGKTFTTNDEAVAAKMLTEDVTVNAHWWNGSRYVLFEEGDYVALEVPARAVGA